MVNVPIQKKKKKSKNTKACEVPSCDNTHVVARGMCWKHYQRYRRHGDPEFVLKPYARPHSCSVPGCNREHNAHGLCGVHYQRMKRRGTIVAHIGNHWDGRMETLSRFTEIDPKTGCWNWKFGSVDRPPRIYLPTENGHSRFPFYVHRIVANHLYGNVDGKQVSRTCRNHVCVNPDHLRVGLKSQTVPLRHTVRTPKGWKL